MSLRLAESFAAVLAVALAGAGGVAQQDEVPWDVAEVFLWDSDSPCTGIVDADGDAHLDLICDDSFDAGSTRVRRLFVRNGAVFHRSSVVLFTQTVEPLQGSREAQWALPGDADADGDADLFWAAGSQVRIFRLPSTYAGFASWQPDFDAGAQIEAAAVADVTDDDAAEVLCFAAGELVFLLRQGNVWLTQRLRVAVQGTPQIFVGETDGDPKREFLLCDDDSVRLVQAAAGALHAHTPLVHYCAHPMPVAGDIDGDGDDDVVVFDDADYVVFRRQAPGIFFAEAKVTGGPATHLVDLDGDGDLDGACCGGGGPTRPPNIVPSPFRLSMNLGGGLFAPAVEIRGIGAQHLAGALDLDLDGDVDLVGGRARVFARGPLLPRSTCESGLPDERIPSPVDLDGDGDLDVEGDEPGKAWINSGAGRFTWEDRRELASRVADLRAPSFWIDLDRDGDRDQVVRRYLGGAFVETILLENRGGWLFDVGPCSSPGAWIGGANGEYPWGRARDLDGDGDEDLVAASAGAFACELWRNESGLLQLWTTLSSEIALEAADFDRDGVLDLLVADGGLGMRLGQAGGLFAARAALVPSQPELFRAQPPSFDPWLDELAVSDLGSFAPAGALDVVAYHRVHPDFYLGPAVDMVVALVNQGDATFVPGPSTWFLGKPYAICLGANPTRGRKVRAADFNGDGSTDLLYSPHERDEGSAALALRDPVQGHAVEGPTLLLRAEHFADVDGDGDTDAFGARTEPGTRWYGERAGSRVQFGTPSEGASGTWPVIGTAHPQRAGLIDVVRLRGALGGAPAAVFLGTQRTQIYLGPGLFFAIADPVLAWAGFLGGAPGVPGDGALDLAFPPLPGYFAGARFGVQALALDPAAQSGIAATPGLWLEKGW